MVGARGNMIYMCHAPLLLELCPVRGVGALRHAPCAQGVAPQPLELGRTWLGLGVGLGLGLCLGLGLGLG